MSSAPMKPRRRFATVATTVLGFFILLSNPCWAGEQVQDSPLYKSTLKEAVADLSQDPVRATARWASDFVFGASAFADTVKLTRMSENTTCNIPRKSTECWKNEGQVCTKTVNTGKKTSCNDPAAGDKSRCVDGGTRCPDGGTKKCLTTKPPGTKTRCQPNKETLCEKDPSQCMVKSERNWCSTYNPDKVKTVCGDGKEVPTLCHRQSTFCNSKGKRMCSTSGVQKNKVLTYCTRPNTDVTMCKDKNLNPLYTTCVDDAVPDSCLDYHGLKCYLQRPDPEPGEDVLVVAGSVDPFWYDNGLEQLLFDMPGAVVTEYTVDDEFEAFFYVNFAGNEEYDVQLMNGVDPPQITGGMLVWSEADIPTLGQYALIVLAVLLTVLGIFVILRR